MPPQTIHFHSSVDYQTLICFTQTCWASLEKTLQRLRHRLLRLLLHQVQTILKQAFRMLSKENCLCKCLAIKAPVRASIRDGNNFKFILLPPSPLLLLPLLLLLFFLFHFDSQLLFYTEKFHNPKFQDLSALSFDSFSLFRFIFSSQILQVTKLLSLSLSLSFFFKLSLSLFI